MEDIKYIAESHQIHTSRNDGGAGCRERSFMDGSFPAVHEPEVEYVSRNRKTKRPHKTEDRQRRGA